MRQRTQKPIIMETEIAKTWILVFILAKNISERVFFFLKEIKNHFKTKRKRIGTTRIRKTWTHVPTKIPRMTAERES